MIPIILATIIFAIASLTDYYDGYIAKKHNAVSNFGKIMDPIADKFLILSAFFCFVNLKIITPWMVLLIFSREIVITVLRLWVMGKGQVLAAEKEGKLKTVTQMSAILTILFFMIFRESHIYPQGHALELWWLNSIYVIMFFTVALTVSSGLAYLWKNRKMIDVA